MNASCICPVCEKKFSAPKNMYKHMRNIHKIDADISNSKITCPVCGHLFTSYNKLRNHVSQDHNIQLESQKLSFQNKTGKFIYNTSYSITVSAMLCFFSQFDYYLCFVF